MAAINPIDPEEVLKYRGEISKAKAEMDRMLEGADALTRKAIQGTDAYKEQVTILKQSNEQLKELFAKNKEIYDSLSQQEKSARALKGVYGTLGKMEHQRVIKQSQAVNMNENDVAVFHGMKHNESFQNIQKKYGNKVLDCEEILVYYKNNTIIFEKNSFLTTKIINENVDFIIKDFTGNILLEIKNQEILKNWVYNVDNVYLYEGLYIIEIIKSNSRIKIYNNLIKI